LKSTIFGFKTRAFLPRFSNSTPILSGCQISSLSVVRLLNLLGENTIGGITDEQAKLLDAFELLGNTG